jgi:plasmid stabilization system protein ParE
VIIRPEAERDIDEAVAWYDGQREGLGDAFQARLDQALEQIDRMPEVHQVLFQTVRRVFVKVFPFSVYYRMEAGEVIVLAVAHSRRDPGRWKSRI